MVPRNSSPVPVKTRKQTGGMPHYVSEKDWEETFLETICVSQHIVAPPHTRLCVSFDTLFPGLFQLETKLLGCISTLLHVATRIVEPKETHVFLVIISNLSSKSWRLLKHMVLARETAPPSFIVRLETVENVSCTTSENTDSTVAAVHQNLVENREDQIEWHEKVHFSDSRHVKTD